MALMLGAALLMAASLPPYASYVPATPIIRAQYTAAYNACLRNTDNAGLSMQVECMAEEQRRQDAALNLVWHKVLTRLGVPRRAAFQADQRRWIKDREHIARNAVDPEMIGGGVTLIYGQSYLDETIRRTI